MWSMADWTDGPEYAPVERPDAFVASAAAPLAALAAEPSAAAAPLERPDFPTAPDAPPLDQLTVPDKDQRDPLAAFAVVSTPLTTTAAASGLPQANQPLVLSSDPLTSASPTPDAGWAAPTGLPLSPPVTSAWGSAHAASAGPRPQDAWAPQQPFALPTQPPIQPPPTASGMYAPQVNPQSFPNPDAHWPVGYHPGQPPTVPQQATAAAIIAGAHPAVAGCLAAGAVLPFVGLAWIAPPVLIVALIVASQRTHYRRAQVRNVMGATVIGSVVLSIVGLADAYSPSPLVWWDAWCGWAQLACWALLPVLWLTVGAAIRRGDRPQP